jgi:Fe2+ or Zn2+ uptake regulation protein
MAGWREVCDECSTTLFNYHYMCKKCGYMICIECSNEHSHEKRKSKYSKISIYYFNFILELKRICMHENSYCLSEFIPWNSKEKIFRKKQ